MPRLHATPLHDAPGLQLVRVACDGCDGPRVAEECATTEHLVLSLHGRFAFRDTRGRAVVAPGVGLLLRPGRPHEISHPHGGGDACLSVRGPWVRRWLEHEDTAFAVSAEGYVELQSVLVCLARGQPVAPLQVEEALCLTVSPPERPRGTTPRASDRRLAETLEHEVALRFDEGLSLDALASRAGVSVFHACRVFRRVTGTTLHQRVQEVRLRHALALVLDTRMPLAEVALEVGFANQGHLGNAFQRRYGTTPGAMRKGQLLPPSPPESRRPRPSAPSAPPPRAGSGGS